MDEIDAKREARRKRILENSERRLFKITGRNDRSEVQENTSPQTFISSVAYEPNLDQNVNGILADRSTQRSTNDNVFTSDDMWDDLPTALNYTCNDAIRNAHAMLSKELNSEKLYNSYSESHNRLGETNVKDSRASGSVKSPALPYAILTNRINYIFLAAIVNVMLILRLDHLFGQAITIPYFTMMLGRLCLCDTMQETQDSSLLFAALILCNIQPGLAYKLKRLLKVLGIIVEDLALYIFSFTLMYYGLSYCLGDIETAVNL